MQLSRQRLAAIRMNRGSVNFQAARITVGGCRGGASRVGQDAALAGLPAVVGEADLGWDFRDGLAGGVVTASPPSFNGGDPIEDVWSQEKEFALTFFAYSLFSIFVVI